MEENKDVLAELNDLELEDIAGGKLGTAEIATISAVASGAVVAALALGIPAAVKKARLKKIDSLFQSMDKISERDDMTIEDLKEMEKLANQIKSIKSKIAPADLKKYNEKKHL